MKRVMTKTSNFVAAVAVVLFVSGCGEREDSRETMEEAGEGAAETMREAGEDVVEVMEDVGAGLSSAWDAVSGYTRERSAEFVEAMERASEATRRRVDEMREFPEYREGAERVDAARERLSEALDRAKEATSETWDDAVDGVKSALENLKEAYRDMAD